VAVDPTNGLVFVTNELDCTVSVIDGRAAVPALLGSPIRVGNGPRGLTLDPGTGRVFVLNKDSVSVIDGRAATPGVIGAPIPAGLPYQAAVDPQSGRVFVGNFGTSGTAASNGTGSIYVIDGRANPPALIGQPLSTATPTGLAVDANTGRVFVANNGLVNTVSVLEGRAATPAFLAGTIAVPLNPIGVMVDPSRGLVFVASSGNNPPVAGSGNITVIDAKTLEPLGTLSTLQFPLFGVSDPVSARVFVGEHLSRRILVLDESKVGR
jgi:DNA-binding beta-propeller fold protein YncE